MKAGETTVLRLLQGSKVFLIPNFQRRYAWRQPQWEELWDDLVREYETQTDSDSQELDGHFLGSVVLHPAAGPASTLMRHLVIDGQQRLTTVIVLLAALRDVRADLDADWNPDSYNSKYLTNPFEDEYPDRLVPTEFDREPYIRTVREGIPTGGIGQAYTYFKSAIQDAHQAGLDLARLGDVLLIHMLLVEINTSTGDSVNNIFNTLNSKGLPLGSTDLIRNELLLNLDEDRANLAHSAFWLPMERSLTRPATKTNAGDGQFITFFWAREVARDQTTTKKNLFQAFERRLRKALDKKTTQQRADVVAKEFESAYQDHLAFRTVLDPAGFLESGLDLSTQLRACLNDLRLWGSEPYLPIALWVLRQHVHNNLDDSGACEALRILLGYLVRRAVAGVPSNNLNRLLSPLPTMFAATESDVEELPSFIRETLSRPAYRWPSNRDIASQLPNQPIYLSVKRGQTRFLLESIERGLSGKELADLSGLTIEHVMPQSLPAEWIQDLDQTGQELFETEALLHTIGNLTLTGYNAELGDSVFAVKRQLLADSPLRMNTEIAANNQWTAEEINRRSETIAASIIDLFEGPLSSNSTAFADRDLQLKRELVSSLQSLPDSAWTTDQELVKLLGAELETVRNIVNTLGPEIARLVRGDSGEVAPWISAELRTQVEEQGESVGVPEILFTAESMADQRLDPDESETLLTPGS